MSQSRSFTDYNSVLEVKQGTSKRFIIDLGEMDLDELIPTNLTPFLKVWAPDGLLFEKEGVLTEGTTDDPTPKVSVLTTAENNGTAGNYEGEIEFRNSGDVVANTHTFNYNVLYTY